MLGSLITHNKFYSIVADFFSRWFCNSKSCPKRVTLIMYEWVYYKLILMEQPELLLKKLNIRMNHSNISFLITLWNWNNRKIEYCKRLFQLKFRVANLVILDKQIVIWRVLHQRLRKNIAILVSIQWYLYKKHLFLKVCVGWKKRCRCFDVTRP